MKNLKQKIRSGEAVHGCWINLGSTVSAEIIGRAGFDWVLIDLEHGAGNDLAMYQQLQVLAGTSSIPLVRTDELSRSKIQRILDAGASGIMFPQVRQAETADEVTRMMYYPPRGSRGMAKMVRAMGFGKNATEYIQNLDKNLLGVVQIETLGALDHLDRIASLDEVDVLFVGPSDLTLALGIFGQLNHPLYQQAIQSVAEAAKKYGKASGVLLLDPEEYEMYYQLGYRFLACGADGTFVARGAEAMVHTLSKKRSGDRT